MGINNIKKCTFSFLFLAAASPASWLYLQLEALSTARAKYFGGVLPFFTALDSGVFPGAPGATQLSPEIHQKSGGLPGVWEFDTRCARRAPGGLIHRLSRDKMSREFGSLPNSLEV